MTYQVTSIDDSAEGMERLRNQDEFILLAYIGKDSVNEFDIEDIVNLWHEDIESCDRFEGFDYDAAHKAVDDFAAENVELIGRLSEALVADLPDEDSDEFDPDMPSPVLRLYVRVPDGMC